MSELVAQQKKKPVLILGQRISIAACPALAGLQEILAAPIFIASKFWATTLLERLLSEPLPSSGM